MSDQEKKQETSISPQPDAENKETSKRETSELSEEELKKVAGGVGQPQAGSGSGAGKA